jgi:hypothetical protein
MVSRMEQDATRQPTLTLAHVSDVHLEPDGPSAGRFAECLRRIEQHPAGPRMILGGGDYIMDAMATPRDRVRAQWDTWHRVLKDNCRLPWICCLGNHDVFGWNHESSGAEIATPGYGKRWAMDELGLKRRFRSLDRGGWHLVVLDSVHPWGRPGGGLAQALLGDEQLEWLVGDLAATDRGKPVLILSHHPIRSSIGHHVEPPRPLHEGDWITMNAWLHMDAELIEPVLAAHGNVRLCLNAHMHRRDRCDVRGIAHIGGGAVCGDLWRDPHPDRPPSCGIVKLYEDGAFEYEWLDL